MKETITARRILEGVLHNLNNPLNLVLGYAQRIKQMYPDSTEADKIYRAGIQMDDLLKDLTQKLWDNSFEIKQIIDLNHWLKGELKYLQNYLPVKHHVVFRLVDKAENVEIPAIPIQLSKWFETALGGFLKERNSLRLQTGVCYYESNPALYMQVLDDTQVRYQPLETNGDEPDLFPGKACESVWDAKSHCLYGVFK